MAGQGALFAASAALLDSVAGALDAYGGGAPAQRYVAPGQPAYDCEQLTVHLGPIQQAPSAAGQGQLSIQHRAGIGIVLHQPVFLISLCRLCYTDETPDPTLLEQTAQRTMDDGWLVWRWLHQRTRDSTLFDATSETAILPAVPINPSGGIYGWVIAVQATIDAPDPAA